MKSYPQHLLLYSIFMVILVILSACDTLPARQWESVAGPTRNPGQSYGSYSAGCLDGAVSLSATATTYQAMRPSRKRFYGHPYLIQFINDYSNQVYQEGLGVIAVGDISQARGGPMRGGHASHQLGLDADIWFKRFNPDQKQTLTLFDLEFLPALSMVDDSTETVEPLNWEASNSEALRLAALDQRVERIFVNYAIKKTLCQNHKGEQWLNKVRPWWGHTYHYHVRLGCPPDSPECVAQNGITDTDGCDATLDWWFSQEARDELEKKAEAEPSEIELPQQCQLVLQAE